eukprot:SAG11_NODE_13_length_26388_cov_67.360341_4_plen_108_part_00
MPAALVEAGVTVERFGAGLVDGIALNANPVCFGDYVTLEDAWRKTTEDIGTHCDRDSGGYMPDAYDYTSMQGSWFRFFATGRLPTYPPSIGEFVKPVLTNIPKNATY